jgi:methylated-DNA-protein-cysteine methyltransferase related protein
VPATSPRPSRTDAVLELVAAIPHGCVMTYGDVAHHLGIPSPRLIGQVLATRGDEVPWHRVVLSTGAVAAHLADRQLSLLRREGVDAQGDRVNLRRHRWTPAAH